MDGGAKAILYVLAGMAGLSMLYFLSLVAHLPLILICLLICIFLALSYRYLFNNRDADLPKYQSMLHVAILAIGCFLVTNRTFYLASKYGGWDAWGIWNLNARYLSYADHWQTLFLNTEYSHSDYPLMLAGVIGFFSRLTLQHDSLIIPFAVSMLATLCIPMLAYLSLHKKSLLIAAASLALFATDEYFLERGISQYADTMLGAYLLAAMVTVNYVNTDKRMIALAAFFAGTMVWTKNEGLLLAVVFLLFYATTFFTRTGIRYFLTGISLPLITLLIFKLFYAPQNDLIHAGAGDTVRLMFQPDRYPLIWKYFTYNANQFFFSTEIVLAFYGLICIIQKRLPDRQAFLLVVCLGVYMLIYAITPYDQDWHLKFSFVRLMHQLMPAFIYVAARRFSGIQLPFIKK